MPLNARPTYRINAALLAVALLAVSLPHALEDFRFREPDRLGVAVWVALTALVAIYCVQLMGAWLCLSGRRWGGRIIAAAAMVWSVGAVLVHGPEIQQAGLAWHFGATSIANVALIVVVGTLTMLCGLRASLESNP